MLKMAYGKLQNPNMSSFYEKQFQQWIDMMKITACKRDAELDVWKSDPTTLV